VDSKIQVLEFGVQYLAQARVMRPTTFVSGASVFPGLASEKNRTPKNHTPAPPMANNDHHLNPIMAVTAEMAP
jgi:hypothetical protein